MSLRFRYYRRASPSQLFVSDALTRLEMMYANDEADALAEKIANDIKNGL